MGKKIENYILESIVGSGQFGKVYKAYNQKNNQVVAIKVIQIEKFRLSPKLQEFTINEINTLSKIQDSTHIVRFIEILKTANNYYFVYQFCNDGTLEERIKADGKISEEQSLMYFQELLNAFKMLVKNNIMHRDIKPSNILLNNGIIKLADFGFCKPMKDAKDLAQTMLGSPIYMAPEILKGQIYTMKADIWSLGVVLYEMIYGFCPFQEKSIARLIGLIEEGTVQFPKSTKISSSTQELLKRMLVKDQFKRIEWRELFEYKLNHQKRDSMSSTDQTINYQYQHSGNSSFKRGSAKISRQSSQQYIEPVQALHQRSQNNPNPFSKKHFSSVNVIEPNQFHQPRHTPLSNLNVANHMNRNRSNTRQRNNYYQSKSNGKSQQKDRKRGTTAHSINTAAMKANERQKEKENIINYQSNSNGNGLGPSNVNVNNASSNTPKNKSNSKLNYFMPSDSVGVALKKTKSSTVTSIPDVDKKIIQNILEKRHKIQKGVKMIGQFLRQSNSKLNVNICCFIAKKIQSFSADMEETARKYIKDNQKYTPTPGHSPSVSTQIYNTIQLILQQVEQISQKLQPFELLLASIHEPQDIIFLRYGEEQHLTQEKEGLSQLLMIDDYLHISPSARQNHNRNSSSSGLLEKGSTFNVYSTKPKRELLEQYQKRILRNI